MKYKNIEWYHWLWIWLWPTKVTVDRDRRGSKLLTTTVKYKGIFGTMYIVDISYVKTKKRIIK